MTQWLIRKETCKCAEAVESGPATNYAQKALSKHGLHRSRQEGKMPIAVVAGGSVFLFLVCIFAISEALGITQVLNSMTTPRKSADISIEFFAQGKQVARMSMSTGRNDWKTSSILMADELRIKDCSISSSDLTNISANSQVNTIVLKNCDGFNESGIGALMENRCLFNFSLDGSKADKYILSALGAGHLQSLDLSHTNIADLNWSEVLGNRRLNRLKVTGVTISAANSQALAKAGFTSISDGFVRQHP